MLHQAFRLKMLLRFFFVVAFLTVLVVSPTTGALKKATASPLPSDNEEWLRKSLYIANGESGVTQDDLLPNRQGPAERDQAAAKEIFDASAKIVADKLSSEATEAGFSTPDIEDQVIVFLTLGEPDSDLRKKARQILKALSGRENVIAIFRGLPPDCRGFGDMSRLVADMIKDLDPQPVVFVDPARFDKYGVTVSPTVLYETADKKAVAWLKGMLGIDWLKEKVASGEEGDLGVHGEVYDLVERPLMEEIEDRINAIDWKKKAEQAKDRFWENYNYVDLPTTNEPETYAITAQYVAKKTIYGGPSGKDIVVEKGQVFDPFDYINPTFYLIIYDASDPRQVEIAKQAGQKATGHYRVKYISTRVPDKAHGWKSYDRMEDSVDAPVYILNKQLVDAFHIQHIPSAVWTENRTIIVQEYGVEN